MYEPGLQGLHILAVVWPGVPLPAVGRKLTGLSTHGRGYDADAFDAIPARVHPLNRRHVDRAYSDALPVLPCKIQGLAW